MKDKTLEERQGTISGPAGVLASLTGRPPLDANGRRAPGRRNMMPGILVSLTLLCGVARQALAGVAVEAPGAAVAGKTIGAWSATWWQWAAALAPPGDPFTDTTGAFANVHQSGPVFLLAGSTGGSNSRKFSVPANTYVLVPLFAGELSQLELGFSETDAQVRQAAQQQANLIDGLHATLDGTTIPQPTLFSHSEVSPDFTFVAVANNQVGIYAVGYSGIAVANGYFLMLDPLSPGTHTLNYGGGVSSYFIYIDETDTITVTPPAPIPLTFQLSDRGAILRWSDASFHLQAAPSAIGIYTNIPGATSPFTNAITEPQKFFRLEWN